jgi:SAM-dependent methyltransferase
MIAQARKRNLPEIESGRVRLIQGETAALSEPAPVDLILAVHLLYFWHEPVRELATIRAALRPAGWVALGYLLRGDMPRLSQKQFPEEGHRLYESDEEVGAVLAEAGFRDPGHIEGPRERPARRLALGRA